MTRVHPGGGNEGGVSSIGMVKEEGSVVDDSEYGVGSILPVVPNEGKEVEGGDELDDGLDGRASVGEDGGCHGERCRERCSVRAAPF